jgi:hypothetical protein
MFALFRRRKVRVPLPLNPHLRRDIGVPLLVSPHAAFLLGLGLGDRR